MDELRREHVCLGLVVEHGGHLGMRDDSGWRSGRRASCFTPDISQTEIGVDQQPLRSEARSVKI